MIHRLVSLCKSVSKNGTFCYDVHFLTYGCFILLWYFFSRQPIHICGHFPFGLMKFKQTRCVCSSYILENPLSPVIGVVCISPRFSFLYLVYGNLLSIWKFCFNEFDKFYLGITISLLYFIWVWGHSYNHLAISSLLGKSMLLLELSCFH